MIAKTMVIVNMVFLVNTICNIQRCFLPPFQKFGTILENSGRVSSDISIVRFGLVAVLGR
jgi:hypothetical protein